MSDEIELIDLVDGVTRFIPQLPTPTAEAAMRESARLFYQDTGVWTQRLPPIDIREVTTGYPLTAPLQAMIERIERLEPGANTKGSAVDRARWHFEPPRNLIFEQLPKEGSEVIPVAVLNLALKAESIPCDHANRYAETLTEGALWLILQQSGMPWAMPEMAEYHRQQFRNAILGVRNQLNAGHRSGSKRVRPQPFI